MSERVRSWRYVALMALIGSGVVVAAAVGVKYKYRFLKTDESGRHIVISEDGRRSWNFSQKTASNPEQAVETAEELDLLIQQGKKELVGAQETEINGHLDNRRLRYRYTLSDGRTVHLWEDDPETGPGTLTWEQKDEVHRLLAEVIGEVTAVGTSDGGRMLFTAQGKEIVVYERVVQGRAMTFQKYALTLADGTEVARSIGRFSEDSPIAATTPGGNVPDAEQIRNDMREIASLRQQDKRQLVAVDELTANGDLDRRVFVYRYQLSDGRTKDMREGAEGATPILSAAQRREWVQSRDAGSGQELGTHEEEVMGRMFTFTRKRYVLNDGTELTWSFGKPKDGQ